MLVYHVRTALRIYRGRLNCNTGLEGLFPCETLFYSVFTGGDADFKASSLTRLLDYVGVGAVLLAWAII